MTPFRLLRMLIATQFVALQTFAATASPESTVLPVLSPEQMNCGNTKITDDSGLSESQANAIAKSLNQVWDVKAANANNKSWPRARHLDGYMLAFCGITRNGRHFVIVDGIYKFLGTMICDDAAGFGVVYDPKSRTFGDITFGVSSCAPPKSKEL